MGHHYKSVQQKSKLNSRSIFISFQKQHSNLKIIELHKFSLFRSALLPGLGVQEFNFQSRKLSMAEITGEQFFLL